jgi:cytochrome c biogenesis protein CcmG, thiol:disulfide interchange protein DsbE
LPVAGTVGDSAIFLGLRLGILHIVTAALLLLSVGDTVASGDTHEGSSAPGLTAALLDGSKFSLADHAGKVVIVNFWATWCGPCWAEMQALEDYYKKRRRQGLEVIAISIDDPRDESRVRDFVRNFSFPVTMLHKATAEGYGRILRVPLTFVVDHKGIIRRDGRRGRPEINLPILEWSVTPYLPRPPALAGER